MTEPARVLCRVQDIPESGAKGFPGPPGSFTGLFAVRQAEEVFVYVNACPHVGTSLDLLPDRFLSQDGTRIICSTHGAAFRIEDGVCTSGPCVGDALETVPCEIEDGLVLVAANGGR